MENSIAQLNEHCQKCKLPTPNWEFKQLSVTPSNWLASVELGDFRASGQGISKKDAQADASQKLQNKLKEEEIWWSQLHSTPLPKGVGGYQKYKPKSKVWQPY